MKKWLFLAIITFAVALVIFKASGPATSGLSLPVVPSVTVQENTGLPVTLFIPKIAVTAQVESVAQDNQGKMDVPKDVDNVAWYNLGVKPGEKGNAVIAGHLDTVTGAPAVFWDLKKLSPGDSIIAIDDKKKEHRFIVVRVQSYSWNKFPLSEVFGPSDKARLNLITCEGVFNSTSGNYSQRLVVYAESKS